jgi:hypothetical protein
MRTLARTLVLTAMLGLTIGTAGRAEAAFVLDQSYMAVPGQGFEAAIATIQSVAQSFTAGLAGQLAEVDVQIGQSTGTTGDDVTLTIRSVAGGVPAAALFQKTIPLATIPGLTFTSMTAVDVSAAGIMVNPGDLLAITLSRNAPGSPPWVLWQSNEAGYARGTGFTGNPGAWTAQTYDFGFRTFVQTSAVPEPSSLALSTLAAVAGLGYAARRHRASHA